MTCIVALEQDGVIYMGGDSAVTDSATMTLRTLRDPKVFINDGMIIGYCSSLRVGQLMQHALVIPEQSRKQSDIEFLVNDFVDAVRNLQRDRGTLKKEDDVETLDAQFLIGFGGKIYCVEDDFQVYQTVNAFGAIGSGSEAALGALYAQQDLKKSPEEKLLLALRAASCFNAGVHPPFYVQRLDPLSEEE